MTDLDHFDICIVGAGVVGLAIAQKISAHPGLKNRSIVLLEKNRNFGEETSSRNSEVIHGGIYYPRHSLKAKLCVEGKEQLYAWCESRQVPFRKTGKLIIAGENQEDSLQSIEQQARLNGVTDLEFLEKKAVSAMEPDVLAHSALFSPSSGIIDSHAYMLSLFHQAQTGELVYSPQTEVMSIDRHARGYAVNCLCQDTDYRFSCENLINAAGLFAQTLAGKITDFPTSAIPEQLLVKGNYFSLQGRHEFRHLIYPVPEKKLRGLGIHLTLDMGGQVKFGPDTETVDNLDYAVNPDRESRFREAIASYYPAIRERQLSPAYSGIRPKLQGSETIADFVIADGRQHGYEGLIQLFGIESPGLTASPAIADEVIKLILA